MNYKRWSISRRDLLIAGGCAAAGSVLADEKAQRRIGLGFSLYGMKSLPLNEAIKACSDIGYDCLELPVLADWPADSTNFNTAARREFRSALADRNLRLSAVMENLSLLADDTAALHRDRLKQAAEVARDIAPDQPPPVETILGGRPSDWEQVKEKMADRLRRWADVMAAAKVVLAIKAHVGNACHVPADLAWLLRQVDSPWIKAAYDYSHFQLRGIGLRDSLTTLLPQTVFIHVKDVLGTVGKFQFLLPGAGMGKQHTDYVAYFRQLAESSYRGDVVVEVSGQIHAKPGYDPLAAARQSYDPMARAFAAAGLR